MRCPAEETLPYVLDVALDVRLAGGVADDGGVDHEAPVPGVLREGAGEDGIIAVALRDGGLQVVEHHAGRDAAERLPGILEPRDEVGQPLRRRHVDVLVATVDQRDEESVDDPPGARRGIGHETQAPEVHLGELPGRHVGHAYRRAPAILKAELADGEAVQRAVRDCHAVAAQQLVHLRQAEPAARLRKQQRADPLALGRQRGLARPRARLLRDGL
jgi:hypothetical protein